VVAVVVMMVVTLQAVEEEVRVVTELLMELEIFQVDYLQLKVLYL
jgi:hypothetical protein